jgi:hypothetical protein
MTILRKRLAVLALGLAVTALASPSYARGVQAPTAPTANSPTCGGYGWGPSSPCYGE